MNDIPWGLAAARKVSTLNAGQKFTTDSTAAVTALLANDSSKTPRMVVLTATVPSLVRTTAGATAVSTTIFDYYLPAGVPVLVEIPQGDTKLDIISEPTAGTGSIYMTVQLWNA